MMNTHVLFPSTIFVNECEKLIPRHCICLWNSRSGRSSIPHDMSDVFGKATVWVTRVSSKKFVKPNTQAIPFTIYIATMNLDAVHTITFAKRQDGLDLFGCLV